MAAHVCFIDIPQEGLYRLQPHYNRSCSGLSPMSSTHSSPQYERNIGFFYQLSRRFGLKSRDDLVYAADEDNSYGSSPDSCSSTSGTQPSMHVSVTALTKSMSTMHCNKVKDALQLHQGSSSEHLSCSSSNTSSNIDITNELQMQLTNSNSNTTTIAAERKLSRISRMHRRSIASIGKVLEGISISTARSLSCSSASKTPQQQRTKDNNNGSTLKSALKTTSALELRKRNTTLSSASSAKSKSTQQPPQRILRQPVSYI